MPKFTVTFLEMSAVPVGEIDDPYARTYFMPSVHEQDLHVFGYVDEIRRRGAKIAKGGSIVIGWP